MTFKRLRGASLTFLLPAMALFPTVRSALADLPYQKIEWPSDDKPHLGDPQVVTEWWYYTGKLTAVKGEQIKHFSYYLTAQYLRDINGNTPTVYAQVTDIEDKKVYGNTFQPGDAKIASDTLRLTSKDFGLEADNGKYHLRLATSAQGTAISFNLVLTPKKAPLLIGPNPSQRGLVTMGNNTNSYYYSITRLQTEGFIQIGGEKFTIDPDTRLSRSWMDHQWGDFSIAQVLKTNPWIWMAIQLDDGTDMNVGEFVSPETGKPNLGNPLANISLPDGAAQYKPAAMIPGPEYEAGYPLGYTLQIEDRSYRMDSIVPNQNTNEVWMGIMSVNGQDVRKPNASFATVETTIPIQQQLQGK